MCGRWLVDSAVGESKIFLSSHTEKGSVREELEQVIGNNQRRNPPMDTFKKEQTGKIRNRQRIVLRGICLKDK
jgi:hypothetical protein